MAESLAIGIPLLICCHWAVLVAMKMREQETCALHACMYICWISWIPFVWLWKSSDLLLHILVSHLQSKFIGSGLVKIKKIRTPERGSGLIGSNFRQNSEFCGIPTGICNLAILLLMPSLD